MPNKSIICKHYNQKASCKKCKIYKLLNRIIDLSSRKYIIRKYNIFELGFCDTHQSITIYSDQCYNLIIESYQNPCGYSTCKGITHRLSIYEENYIYQKCMSCTIRAVIIRLIKCPVELREKLLAQYDLEKNSRCIHNYINLFCRDCYPNIF